MLIVFYAMIQWKFLRWPSVGGLPWKERLALWVF